MAAAPHRPSPPASSAPPDRPALPGRLVEICFMDATALSRALAARRLSAVDVMTSCLAQIDRVNPAVNAICTLRDRDQLLAEARAADEQLAKGERAGPLHGFPHAVKDLVPTAGIRTTYGSSIYKDFVPAEDALLVRRLKAAGAIII